MTKMWRRTLLPRHPPLHCTHRMSLTLFALLAFRTVPGGSDAGGGGPAIPISSRFPFHPRAQESTERGAKAAAGACAGAFAGASFRAGDIPRSPPGASSSLLAFRPPLHLRYRGNARSRATSCVPFLRALRGGGGKHRERRRSKSGGGGSPGK
jgi:hypothetical protein